MIRALLTVAAPVAVLGLAAAPLMDAGLLSAPRGEPLLVAAAPNHVHKAVLDGSCTNGGVAETVAALPETPRVIALRLAETGGGFSVTARAVPVGAPMKAGSLVLLVTASGHILFAGDPADLADAMAAPSADCGETLGKPGAV